MKRLAASGIACATLALAAACGSSSSGDQSVNPGGNPTSPSVVTPPIETPTPTASTTLAKGCTAPPALQKKHLHFSKEPKVTIAPTTYTAKVVTNCGTITVALNGKKAPHTVNSFAFLAGKGYFTDTPCHRLVTSGIYVLQCGDPTGTGSGGPGYTIPDENLSGATYPPGTVAMANTGQAHSGGSQFFFVYGPTPLPPKYTPFGTVTSGLQVLKNIAAAGTDNSAGEGDGAPNQPVVIEKFTVTKG